jgi:putative transposase
MENSKILIEINAEELTNMIKNQPELFIGETLKDVIKQSIQKEYEEKTGEKYSRESEYQRWSSNPGSVNINNEKVKIEVPRMRNKQTLKTEEPEIYKEMNKKVEIDRRFLRLLVNGLSQRKYKKAAQLITESFGLSQSRMSRLFSKEAEKALKEFESRDFGHYDFICLMIDGKYFSKQQIVHAVGITRE